MRFKNHKNCLTSPWTARQNACPTASARKTWSPARLHSGGDGSFRRVGGLALILIAITGAALYSNIYHAPFVFDDLDNIVENGRIRDLSYYSSLEQILKLRNIVYLTFAVNYKLCGYSVVSYHIFNITIHVLNGFLVYFFSLMIFKRLNNISQSPNTIRLNEEGGQTRHKKVGQAISLMSLFTALIFVSHPIQTQAVTYTVQRIASMAAMFYMASVFFILKQELMLKV